MGENIAEYLTRTRATRGLVSRTQFTNSVDHLREYASWAVWGTETHDLTVFQEPRLWERLRKDVFLFGGNTGLFGGGRPADFSNFHTRGHIGDTKLRRAITGTPLEGAYLSDIVKDAPTKDSNALIRDIRAGRVNVTDKVIRPLQRELELLDAPDDTMLILLGKGTARVWDAVTGHASFPVSLASRLEVVTGVQHYTAPVDFTDEITDLLSQTFPPVNAPTP